MDNKVIISDTSCLIAFDRINRLEILHQTFPVIITTKEVFFEFGKSFPAWIKIMEVKNQNQKEKLEKIIDKGEASAIALALETNHSVLIIDEKKGRRLAKELGIEIIGSLKVLLIAKQKGIIVSVKEIIQELEQANFRFSKTIVNELLNLAKE